MNFVTNPLYLIIACLVFVIVAYSIAWVLSWPFFWLTKLPEKYFPKKHRSARLKNLVHFVLLAVCEVYWFAAWGHLAYPIVMVSPIQ